MKGSAPFRCHDRDPTVARSGQKRLHGKRFEYGRISHTIDDEGASERYAKLLGAESPPDFRRAGSKLRTLLRTLECRRQQLTLGSQYCCEP